MITILNNEVNTYNVSYDIITDIKSVGDLNNKLFCTFTNLDNLDNLIEDITSKYTIIYNISTIPDNTILVHRKKESNTLYTINALNELIKKLNGGVVDTSYQVDWQHYKNCILLTQHNDLNQLNTKIHKIIDL